MQARLGLQARRRTDVWGPQRGSRVGAFDAWAVVLCATFLAAHLAFLPPTLEDLDSMNFALGIRDFDPAKHQPHPPGYPAIIALGKIANAVLRSEVTALAFWSALFGALAIFPLMGLFRCIEALDPFDRETDVGLQRAAFATLLVVASPAFWFSALRPMSDIPGLTMALAAQASLAAAFTGQRRQVSNRNAGPAEGPLRGSRAGALELASTGKQIVLGALLAGLAMGFRTQTVWLTVPLLLLVLIDRVGRGAAGALLGSAMTFSIGVLAWAVPLLIASGGIARYRAALSGQTTEQFTGLDILLSNPTPRRFLLGTWEALVHPWAVTPLGIVVVVLAIVGFAVLARRAPAAAVLVATVAVPYGLFHLVVQETLTRYALPLVPAVGYLALRGLGVLGRRAVSWGTAAIVLASLVVTLPAASSYGSNPSPTFKALNQVAEEAHAGDITLAMHQGFARAVETEVEFQTQLESHVLRDIRILKAPPMLEWFELVNYWREGRTTPVWFLADPARTDLELIDPASRSIRGHYDWTFPRLQFMGGVRPDIVDVVRIESPPGWFCDEGWHLTPETLGMSERQTRHRAVAHIRPRTGPVLLLIGGQYLPVSGGPDVTMSATIDGQLVDQWTVLPGQRDFLRRVLLEPGKLDGAGLAELVVSYEAADGSGRPVRIRLTQFAAQSPSEVFHVPLKGWWEIEYSMQLQQRWRWISDRSQTFINAGGRDLVVTLAGESPLRYFDSAPHVAVRAGDRVLATASPASDFEMTVNVPASALAASDSMLTIETDKSFVPGEESGSPDQRRLGLRIFRFDVKPR